MASDSIALSKPIDNYVLKPGTLVKTHIQPLKFLQRGTTRTTRIQRRTFELNLLKLNLPNLLQVCHL